MRLGVGALESVWRRLIRCGSRQTTRPVITNPRSQRGEARLPDRQGSASPRLAWHERRMRFGDSGRISTVFRGRALVFRGSDLQVRHNDAREARFLCAASLAACSAFLGAHRSERKRAVSGTGTPPPQACSPRRVRLHARALSGCANARRFAGGSARLQPRDKARVVTRALAPEFSLPRTQISTVLRGSDLQVRHNDPREARFLCAASLAACSAFLGGRQGERND